MKTQTKEAISDAIGDFWAGFFGTLICLIIGALCAFPLIAVLELDWSAWWFLLWIPTACIVGGILYM